MSECLVYVMKVEKGDWKAEWGCDWTESELKERIFEGRGEKVEWIFVRIKKWNEMKCYEKKKKKS